jgi:4,5-DOPA dioxygenase extradiol
MTAPETTTRMPALYLGHGAPPLIDDPVWPGQLAAWSRDLPRPKAILIVSAHWESAPLTIGATTPVPLVYDFSGFPRKYYELQYRSPGAPELAAKVRALMPDDEPVYDDPARGLDHGAYMPLLAMYPEADIPVLQISMPDLDPLRLFKLGQRLAPLRGEGVLIIGSGFMTHGLPYINWAEGADGTPPGFSVEFDEWVKEGLVKGNLDDLLAFREKGPGTRYAHPTVDHFVPLFVTLGAATDPGSAPEFEIEGYWFGLAKRSLQVA